AATTARKRLICSSSRAMDGRRAERPASHAGSDSDASRDRRLAECLEVLDRVPKVSFEESAEYLLRDAGKEALRQVVLDLDRAIRAAPGLGVGDRHRSRETTRATELQRVGMWLVGPRRLLGALDPPPEDPRNRGRLGADPVESARAILDLDDVHVPLGEPFAGCVDLPDVVDGRVDVLA